MILPKHGPRVSRGDTSLSLEIRGLEWMGDPRRSCAGLTDIFCSDHIADLNKAAKICHTCPFIAACDEYATSNKERAGVWGGRNRGPTPPRPEGARTHERQQLPEDVSDEDLIESVLTRHRGRFGDLSLELQRRAAVEGITRIGIGKLAHRLGVKAAVLYELAHGRPIADRIQELYDQGHGDERIGADVGLTARMIRDLRSQFGIVAEGWKKVPA